MSALRLLTPHPEPLPAARRRRAFGLDSPLPADRHAILRAVLRHLAEQRPSVVAFWLGESPSAPDHDGVEGPDLLLLAPGGRSAFVTIKPQAAKLTRAHRSFADLCRSCAMPLLVVRSLPEAKRAFDALHL